MNWITRAFSRKTQSANYVSLNESTNCPPVTPRVLEPGQSMPELSDAPKMESLVKPRPNAFVSAASPSKSNKISTPGIYTVDSNYIFEHGVDYVCVNALKNGVMSSKASSITGRFLENSGPRASKPRRHFKKLYESARKARKSGVFLAPLTALQTGVKNLKGVGVMCDPTLKPSWFGVRRSSKQTRDKDMPGRADRCAMQIIDNFIKNHPGQTELTIGYEITGSASGQDLQYPMVLSMAGLQKAIAYGRDNGIDIIVVIPPKKSQPQEVVAARIAEPSQPSSSSSIKAEEALYINEAHQAFLNESLTEAAKNYRKAGQLVELVNFMHSDSGGTEKLSAAIGLLVASANRITLAAPFATSDDQGRELKQTAAICLEQASSLSTLISMRVTKSADYAIEDIKSEISVVSKNDDDDEFQVWLDAGYDEEFIRTNLKLEPKPPKVQGDVDNAKVEAEGRIAQIKAEADAKVAEEIQKATAFAQQAAALCGEAPNNSTEVRNLLASNADGTSTWDGYIKKLDSLGDVLHTLQIQKEQGRKTSPKFE